MVVVRDGRLQPRTVFLNINGVNFDHRSEFSFDVTHDNELFSRPSTITIKNIGTRRDALIASQNANYRLEAGFGTTYGTICAGAIDTITEDWQGSDSITQIQLRNHVPQDFLVLEWDGAPLGAALHEIAISTAQRLDPLPDLPIFRQPVSWAFAGSANDALEELAEDYGLLLAQVCDRLIVQPQGSAYVPTAVISEDRGMLGHPTRTEDGFVARLNLDASKYPLQIVTLSSLFLSGVYRLVSVRHQGQTRGRMYETVVRGVAL